MVYTAKLKFKDFTKTTKCLSYNFLHFLVLSSQIVINGGTLR